MEASKQAADLCKCHGGEIMSIRRTVISAIVALSAAGSIAGSSAAIAATAQASTVTVAATAIPNTFFHA